MTPKVTETYPRGKLADVRINILENTDDRFIAATPKGRRSLLFPALLTPIMLIGGVMGALYIYVALRYFQAAQYGRSALAFLGVALFWGFAAFLLRTVIADFTSYRPRIEFTLTSSECRWLIDDQDQLALATPDLRFDLRIWALTDRGSLLFYFLVLEPTDRSLPDLTVSAEGKLPDLLKLAQKIHKQLYRVGRA